MSYVTTISLDEVTHSIAKERIRNLSGFVRDMIRIHYGAERHTMSVQKYHVSLPGASFNDKPRMLTVPRCNPYSKLGRCYLCWPNGEGELEAQIIAAAEKEGVPF